MLNVGFPHSCTEFGLIGWLYYIYRAGARNLNFAKTGFALAPVKCQVSHDDEGQVLASVARRARCWDLLALVPARPVGLHRHNTAAAVHRVLHAARPPPPPWCFDRLGFRWCRCGNLVVPADTTQQSTHARGLDFQLSQLRAGSPRTQDRRVFGASSLR